MLREDLLFFISGKGGGFTRELLLRFLLYIAFLVFVARILFLGVTVYRTKHAPAIPGLPSLQALPGNSPQPVPDTSPINSKGIDSI